MHQQLHQHVESFCDIAISLSNGQFTHAHEAAAYATDHGLADMLRQALAQGIYLLPSNRPTRGVLGLVEHILRITQ